MHDTRLRPLVRQLGRLASVRGAEDLSDAELLERFALGRDETAFTALVRRHGRLVLGVCRQILGNAHDADDAFQAVFLVLARHAASIRAGVAVASWLYRVAYRIATRAGMDMAKRRARERRPSAPTPPRDEPQHELAWRELQTVLHEELDRLPEIYRAPFVLCCVEGKSGLQAARELGVKEGTVTGRLSRARKLLQERLARRGFTLPAVLAATALWHNGALAVTATLARTTTQAALLYAAGKATGPLSASAAALAEGAITTMFTPATRLTMALLGVLTVCLLSAGALTLQAARPVEPATPAVLIEERSKADPAQDVPEGEATFAGRVVGPDDRPFRGARVYLLYFTPRVRPLPVRATTDAEGKFRFTVARKDLDRSHSTEPWDHASVVALADGHGMAFVIPDPTQPAPRKDDLTLRLVRDDVPAAGRIVDLEGRPVAGATVTVNQLLAPRKGDLAPFRNELKEKKEVYNVLRAHLSGFEGTWIGRDVGRPFPVTKTDADGRFTLRGVGRERLAGLRIEGPTIETQDIWVLTRPGKEKFKLPGYKESPRGDELTIVSTGFEHVAGPATIIVGVVRDRETRRPLAGAEVTSYQRARHPISHRTDLRTTTDPEGRFRLNGMPRGEGNIIAVIPSEGQPYVMATRRVPVPQGNDPVTVDFDMKRGVLVTGKVIDRATGRPVAARVEYFAFPDNPHVQEAPGFIIDPYLQTRADDGSFRLVALPGRGLIAARGTEDRFVTGLGAEKLKRDRSDVVAMRPHYLTPSGYHTLVEIKPDKTAEAMTVEVALDPGRTLTGKIVGPDGKPLSGARVRGLKSYGRTGYWDHHALSTDQFTATGLARGIQRRLLFIHQEKKLSGTVVISGDDREPPTVKLQPWGEVTGRIVDADGRPRPGVVLMPQGAADGTDLARGDVPQWPRPVTDKDGRFRIVGLVPGLKYTVAVIEQGYIFAGNAFKDVTIKGGETRDVGTVEVRPASD